ncbi:MAG: EamA family transporter [Bacteroidota bacterium]|nr:EamA family transporter [Bacteroidota bacterium]
MKHLLTFVYSNMKNQYVKWLYLAILSLVWGSSYILIKWGLVALTPLQLGSLRLLITTIALLMVGYSSLRGLSKYHLKWLAITGYVGTFFPAFLFAFAQQFIDSAIAAILNALTPLLTIIFGLLFFRIDILKKQYFGVGIGLLGSIGLVWGGLQTASNINPIYTLLILAASCCYAINIHFIKIHLAQVGVMAITLGNFVFMAPAALVVLICSDFFTPQTLSHPEIYPAIGYITILALAGSAFAKYLFNKFVKITSAVFASSVTYTLPVVALFWGVYDGEVITKFQLLSTAVILVGVYLSHTKKAA